MISIFATLDLGNGKGLREEVMVIDQAYLTQALRSRTAPGHPSASCDLVSEKVMRKKVESSWYMTSLIKL